MSQLSKNFSSKNLGSRLPSLKESFLDLLFPHFCLGCQTEGAPLCPECLAKIALLESQVCPWCEITPTPAGEICPACQQKDARGKTLTRLLVAASYEENLLARAVHLFKYRFVEDLSSTLALLLQQTLQRFPFPEGPQNLLIPVPLHCRRLRYRGFNQSEALAQALVDLLENSPQNNKPALPPNSPGKEEASSWQLLPDLLLRHRYTPPQMEIKSRPQRLENLKDAFSINPKWRNRPDHSPDQWKSLQNKNIWLLDDISTTGATLLECARALAPLQPRSVSALVLARQKSH
jgi:predicted amidophosphoribosyltransferase